MSSTPQHITVGELVARFLEACQVKTVFGVISIHNMPMLDAFHRRGAIRFVSSRGEAGACNMADAAARISGTLGVCVTSTGTGCGNAAGAMVGFHWTKIDPDGVVGGDTSGEVFVSANDVSVTVTLHREMALLGVVGVSGKDVSATRTARAVDR